MDFIGSWILLLKMLRAERLLFIALCPVASDSPRITTNLLLSLCNLFFTSLQKSKVFVLKVTLRISSESSSQERLSPKLFCSVFLISVQEVAWQFISIACLARPLSFDFMTSEKITWDSSSYVCKCGCILSMSVVNVCKSFESPQNSGKLFKYFKGFIANLFVGFSAYTAIFSF